MTGESLFENALAQSPDPFQADPDRSFGLLDDRKAAFHFSNNTSLFGNWWDRKRDFLDAGLI